MARGKKTDTDYNTIYWRWHDTNKTRVRMWRAFWEGDQFDMLNATEWMTFEQWLKRLGFKTVDMTDSDG